jgi:cell division septation protein DedD
MKDDTANFDDDFDDIDEVDAEDGDRGVSGLVVLLMGAVMFGAVASVVWIAYQHGVKTGARGTEAPYVTADPEPLKIENQVAAETDGMERQVYDRFEGANGEPVDVIAEGPEEPVERSSYDPIGDIASDAAPAASDDAVADRIAALAAEDAALNRTASAASVKQEPVKQAPAKQEPLKEETAPSLPPRPEPRAQTQPTPASTGASDAGANAAPRELPTVSYRNESAASGSHLVQVGAFRSEQEATAQWTSLQKKLGDLAAGKSDDIERADLGAKGVYYRLRIGPFSSKADATQYCGELKQRGTDCLIKAR